MSWLLAHLYRQNRRLCRELDAARKAGDLANSRRRTVEAQCRMLEIQVSRWRHNADVAARMEELEHEWACRLVTQIRSCGMTPVEPEMMR